MFHTSGYFDDTKMWFLMSANVIYVNIQTLFFLEVTKKRIGETIWKEAGDSHSLFVGKM